MKEGNSYRRAIICLALLFAPILAFSFATQTNATTIFTGDVPTDFAESNATIIVDNTGTETTGTETTDAETTARAIESEPDVSMPSPPYSRNNISGWDINAMYLDYDPLLDMMFVGVDCFTICGDADGDGDPSRAGSIMRADEGTDVAHLGRFESIALLIDTNQDYRSLADGDFEVVVGVSQLHNIDRFGAYKFTGAIRAPYIGFGQRLSNPVTKYSIPSELTPDLQFGIANFSQLPGFDFDPGDEFSFQVMLYAGSQRDGDIGEDYVPSRGKAASVTIERSRRAIALNPVVATSEPARVPTRVPTQQTTQQTASVSTSVSTSPPTLTPTHTPPPTPIPTHTPPPTPAPLSNDPPQRLQVPAIGVDTVVQPMGWSQVQQDDGTFATLWDVVDNAAGWHMNSSLPDRSGNVVLSGHNTIGGSVFRDLYHLQEGDDIVLWHDDKSHEYEINSVIIVPEQYASHAQRLENAAYMGNFGDDRITLISCWPPGSASHRVIVIGESVIDPTSE